MFRKDETVLSLSTPKVKSLLFFAPSPSLSFLSSPLSPLLRTGVSLTFDPDICVLQECLCAPSAL